MFNFRVPFVTTLLSASHTGADVSRGTIREHRTEKQLIKSPYSIRSKFSQNNKTLKHECIALLFYRIYELIEDKARFGIHDEYGDAIAVASKWNTKGEFLEIITRKLEIGLNKIRNDGRLSVLDLFNAFEDDNDLLQEIRNEHQYLMFRFKMIHAEFKKYNEAMVQYNKELKEYNEASLYKKEAPVAPNKDFIDNLETKLLIYCDPEIEATLDERTINYANLPFYSGNSIKGILRRELMREFCELSGLSKKTMGSTAYHRLFTGGVISKASGDERIDRKREMIELCPPLGLLGSAVEDGTITADICVNDLQLRCKERGTGINSFTELIVPRFLTRLDSSKLEKFIDIAEIKKGEVETHQMKYLTEVMIAGSELDGELSLLTSSEIVASCFARAITLMKNKAHIGGKGTVGFGRVEFSGLEAPAGVTEDAYLQFVAENKERILAYGW